MEITSPTAETARAGPECELCQHDGGLKVWSDGQWRVIRVQDEAFPAFYRVVCESHIGEFSQLSASQRVRCMDIVARVEQVLIAALEPTKVNLAALGNVVPHLHWHVVARFEWDSHFPQPIWGVAQRSVHPPPLSRLARTPESLDEALRQALRG